jgi:NTP pyrophosphatase (non-canonical NTP hydrolase)
MTAPIYRMRQEQITQSNWIEYIGRWRTHVEILPHPFVTGTLLDNAYFFLGEAGELLEVLHKMALSGLGFARNVNSTKVSIFHEVGDCMLMLGTVAWQSGALAYPGSITIWGKDHKMIGLVLVDEAVEIVKSVNNGYPVKLDDAMTLIFDICELYQINPWEALRASMTGIEQKRCMID